MFTSVRRATICQKTAYLCEIVHAGMPVFVYTCLSPLPERSQPLFFGGDAVLLAEFETNGSSHGRKRLNFAKDIHIWNIFTLIVGEYHSI